MSDAVADDLTAKWFALITEVSALAAKQIARAPEKPPTETRALFAWTLFMRGVTSLQAATLLAESNFVTDAGTICRSVLETVFALGALAAGYDLAGKVARANLATRRKIANEMLLLHPTELRPLGEIAERLRSFLAQSDDEKDSIVFKQLADKAGLSSAYTVWYRSLSDNCAHPSANSLERQLRISDGEAVAFTWGPRLLGRISCLQCICAFSWYLLKAMVDYLDSEEIDAGLNAALERYHVLEAESERARAASLDADQ